jgi:hypothetical protein
MNRNRYRVESWNRDGGTADNAIRRGGDSTMQQFNDLTI